MARGRRLRQEVTHRHPHRPLRGRRPTVVGPAAPPPSRTHRDEVRFTRAHTRQPLKFTIPGPMTIVDTLADEHYRRAAKLAMEFAKLINEEARELEAARRGRDPARRARLQRLLGRSASDWGVAAAAPRHRGLRCKTAVHICYGYGIKANIDWKNDPGRRVAPVRAHLPLLARSRIGQISLECANSHVPIELLALLEGKDDPGWRHRRGRQPRGDPRGSGRHDPPGA